MTTRTEPLPTAERTDLTGRVVWVTGAGRGLGASIALGFRRAGAVVAVSARSQGPLQEFVHATDDLPGAALPVPCDVADPDAVRDAADRIRTELGPIRTLVNMAGINPTVTRSENLPDDKWADVIETNLHGTFYCCREAGRQMLSSGDGGAIVNVSSVHGSVGVARMAAYAASKGGVETLTKALALEWADRGVRVNCLAPGYFRTALTEPYLASSKGHTVIDRIPMARVGEPDELVQAALYLGSDDSSYVTGTTLTVDGGWTAQ